MGFVPQTQYSCSQGRRDLFLEHNFFIFCVDEIFILISYVDEIYTSDAILVPYSRRDLFLGHNILVPRVDEICSSNIIFLFLVSMRSLFLFPVLTRFVPQIQFFFPYCRRDLFLRHNNLVPGVDEICSLRTIFFVSCVDEIFILVPCVDEICSSDTILVPYSR
jgi:hypothetical protein